MPTPDKEAARVLNEVAHWFAHEIFGNELGFRNNPPPRDFLPYVAPFTVEEPLGWPTVEEGYAYLQELYDPATWEDTNA